MGVAAEAEMRVEVASGDTAVSPWGLSSSPHFNTINQQSNTSLSQVMVWSVVSVFGTGRLQIVKGNMNQDQYKTVSYWKAAATSTE